MRWIGMPIRLFGTVILGSPILILTAIIFPDACRDIWRTLTYFVWHGQDI